VGVSVMEALFWIFIGGVLWTYVGYPLVLLVLARVAPRKVTRKPFEPSVSLVIAAYNEEKDIRQKLTNSLELDYPRDKLQIIVVSDCSTDRTHAIVREFETEGVELVILPERGGKTAAQNAAAAKGRCEILVFTDATTELHRRTVKDLVEGFADPRVGCIGGAAEYVSADATAVGKGGGAYRRHEKKVEVVESAVDSLMRLFGCRYPVRASVYTPIDPDLISDFVVAGEVFAKGYITTYARGAVSQEKTHEDSAKEFAMRVRVAVRSINALVRNSGMLNPFRYGFFAFQIVSHKVLRYLVPEMLLGALVLNILLVAGASSAPRLYGALLAGQLAVYLAALLGALSHRLRLRTPLVHVPFYFVHGNAAVLWGLIQYLRGERKITWARS